MSEALVPAVARPPVARPGSAAMALPAVIVDAGPVAVERFLEFFAASISNGRTRAAYGRAVGQFLSWCAARGLGLRAIAPLHVAAYIRTHPGSAPTVKQHLAAIRVLCDWLVVHQVLPVNPAAAVRGPKHVVTKGATPVLTPAETRSLLDGSRAATFGAFELNVSHDLLRQRGRHDRRRPSGAVGSGPPLLSCPRSGSAGQAVDRFGRTDLLPARAFTYNAGTVLFLEGGVEATVDYWHYDFENAIQPLLDHRAVAAPRPNNAA